MVLFVFDNFAKRNSRFFPSVLNLALLGVKGLNILDDINQQQPLPWKKVMIVCPVNLGTCIHDMIWKYSNLSIILVTANSFECGGTTSLTKC